jgi:signal peptidase I
MLPTTLLADPILLRPRPRAPRVTIRLARAVPQRGSLAIAALVAMVAGALAFLQVWPPLATVMSASMAPTIKTGDMVVLQRLHGPARIGDVVAVSVPDEARSRYGYPPVVIHRVVSIAPDGTVRTKGDARPDPDPFTVPRTALTTKVIAHIPAGGRVLAFFHSGPGLLWLAFGALLFVGLPLLDRQRDSRRRDDDTDDELRKRLETIAAELTLLRADHLREQAELQRRLEAAQHEAAAPLAARLESIERALTTPAPPAPKPRPAPLPAYAGRWDAPPPAALSQGPGWAARPVAAKRFQRAPGRLVAASALAGT